MVNPIGSRGGAGGWEGVGTYHPVIFTKSGGWEGVGTHHPVIFTKPGGWEGVGTYHQVIFTKSGGWEGVGTYHPVIFTKSNFLWANKNLFWQRSRDGNSQGLGVPHAVTVSQKPSCTALWRADGTVVGKGNAGWTVSVSGHPCPCQNCSR